MGFTEWLFKQALKLRTQDCIKKKKLIKTDLKTKTTAAVVQSVSITRKS